MKFTISDIAAVCRLVTFKNNRNLITAFSKVTVKAVCSCIQGAVFIPFDAEIIRVIRNIFNFCIWFNPINALSVLSPECFIVIDGCIIHGKIFVIIHMCIFGYSRRWWKDCIFRHNLTPLMYRQCRRNIQYCPHFSEFQTFFQLF